MAKQAEHQDRKWLNIQGVHKVLLQFLNFIMKSVLNKS